MSNFLDFFLDFSEFGPFHLLAQTNYTKVVTSQKKCPPSQKYIFKIFKFNCNSAKNQKIILDTFYQICRKKNQYLRCYNQLSFIYESENTPTLSMKYISSKTLEDVLNTPDLLKSWKFENSLKCIFAISEAMCYLHEHLIYHGNLCPSNIIIDDADQFYLSDFGLYPIKKLYIEEKYLFNETYKDPNMHNNIPTFKNDIYSFGILMCEFIFLYFQSKNEIKNETLQNFIKKSEKSNFDSFPRFFSKLIPSCLSTNLKERPTFRQIIELFKTTKYNVLHINIQKLYTDFIKSDYLINLSLKGDIFALNKVGEMYDEGKLFEQDIEKAKEFYKKAALLNNSEAQSNFGVLLQESNDKEDTDMIEGAHYLKLSAKQGNVHGMANYGVALLYGHGVKKDVEKAKIYLKRAADLGYSYAQDNYGFALIDNNPNDDEIIEGLNYIKKAMDQNDFDAYYTYGVILQQGKVVDKNDQLAMEYFKISADHGYAKAMYEYAKGCMSGEGVPKNFDAALTYYKMAGDNGFEINTKTLDELTKRVEEEGKNKSKKSTKPKKRRTTNKKESKNKKDKKPSLLETQKNETNADDLLFSSNQLDEILTEDNNDKTDTNYIDDDEQNSYGMQESFDQTADYTEESNNQQTNSKHFSQIQKPNDTIEESKNQNQPQEPKEQDRIHPSTRTLEEHSANGTKPKEIHQKPNSNQDKIQQPNNSSQINHHNKNTTQIGKEQESQTNEANNPSDKIAPTNESESSEEEEEEEDNNDNQSEENCLDKILNLDLPSEELIKLGEIFEKEDLSKSLQYYEEAAKKGNKEAYLKCANICFDFGTRIKYYDLAIKSEIPGAFSELRKYLSKQLSLRIDVENYNVIGKIFERYNDYSDAAIYYKKSKDIQNFEICFEKAKQNINDIKDGNQQFTFGVLLEKQNELPLSLMMFRKSLENGVSKAEKKIAKIEKILQSMPTSQQPLSTEVQILNTDYKSSASIEEKDKSLKQEELPPSSAQEKAPSMKSDFSEKTNQNANSLFSSTPEKTPSWKSSSSLSETPKINSAFATQPSQSTKTTSPKTASSAQATPLPNVASAQDKTPRLKSDFSEKTNSMLSSAPPQSTKTTSRETLASSNQAASQLNDSSTPEKTPSWKFNFSSQAIQKANSTPPPQTTTTLASSSNQAESQLKESTNTEKAPIWKSNFSSQAIQKTNSTPSPQTQAPTEALQSNKSPTQEKAPTWKSNSSPKAAPNTTSTSTDQPSTASPQANPTETEGSSSVLSNNSETFLQKGINYYEGRNGFKVDYNKAMFFFKKASKQGCPKADFYIGDYYKNEFGAEHMKRAADSGDPQGQLQYGKYLKNGIGVQKNTTLAMLYYELAADQGLAEAQFEFGREKFENGLTENDKEDGIYNIVKSIGQNYPDALYYYSKILKDIEPEKSNNYYQRSLELNSQLALKEQETQDN